VLDLKGCGNKNKTETTNEGAKTDLMYREID
jgi:hypothetical protein